MKKHIKTFIMNGLFICGLGPVVWAIVYAVLNVLGVVTTMSVGEMVTSVISATVLAFIAGGISVIYKIEKLPVALAAMIHTMVLYVDYIVIYLINGWLKSGMMPFVLFTTCFFLGFALIWLIIYLTTKKSTDEINSRLASMQSEIEE